jgi:hypothetical protein
LLTSVIGKARAFRFSYGDVSYDGSADSTDGASLDVDGNPIQDQLSSANCVQSPP